MPKGKPTNHGNLQGPQALFEDVAEGLAVFFGGLCLWVHAPAVDSDSHPSDLLEYSGIQQVRQHPVEAIGDFVQILEK
jgi:hypothetical protein